jgi:hypothetical protein
MVSSNHYKQKGPGSTVNKATLNYTLLVVAKILNELNLTKWFIGYGTLLGIVRGDECIEGDDDVDIVCNKEDFDKLKQGLQDAGFTFCYDFSIGNSRNIIKTNETDQYCSVDFYMATVNEESGDYHDQWERVIWSNCYGKSDKKELLTRQWRDTVLLLPHDYKSNLENRYGSDWMTPKKSKGPEPRKTRI